MNRVYVTSVMKNVLSNKKGLTNFYVCVAEKHFKEEIVIKSVFDHRFKSNKHTHIFLFVT